MMSKRFFIIFILCICGCSENKAENKADSFVADLERLQKAAAGHEDLTYAQAKNNNNPQAKEFARLYLEMAFKYGLAVGCAVYAWREDVVWNGSILEHSTPHTTQECKEKYTKCMNKDRTHVEEPTNSETVGRLLSGFIKSKDFIICGLKLTEEESCSPLPEKGYLCQDRLPPELVPRG